MFKKTRYIIKPEVCGVGSLLTETTTEWFKPPIVQTYICIGMCPFMGAKWKVVESGIVIDDQDMNHFLAGAAQAALKEYFRNEI